jgi:hypothetical protein
MNDEQLPYAKTAITRIVMEKIPKAKRWPVSKEFKSWIDDLTKEQFEVYLDRLRALNRTLSNEEPAGASTETGRFILLDLTHPVKLRRESSLRGWVGKPPLIMRWLFGEACKLKSFGQASLPGDH